MDHSREALDDVELIIKILQLIAVELLPIIGDKFLGDPKPTNDESSDETVHLFGGYSC